MSDKKLTTPLERLARAMEKGDPRPFPMPQKGDAMTKPEPPPQWKARLRHATALLCETRSHEGRRPCNFCRMQTGLDSEPPAPTPEPQSCQRCGRFNNAHPLPDCPTFHEAGTPETTRPAAEINAEDDGTFIDLGTPETPSALPSCQEPLGSGRWCGLPLLHSGDHEAAEGETPSALTAHKAFARPECLAIEREAADLREKRSTAERQRDKAADVLCEIAIIVDAEPGPIPPAIQRLKLRAEAAEAELARVTESVRNICENSNPTYRTRVGQVLAFLDGLQERERKGE